MRSYDTRVRFRQRSERRPDDTNQIAQAQPEHVKCPHAYKCVSSAQKHSALQISSTEDTVHTQLCEPILIILL